MPRYLVISTVRVGPLEYRKGVTIEMTSAQVTSLGATNFRLVNNPVNTNGSHAASETHDTLGMSAAVSNSS